MSMNDGPTEVLRVTTGDAPGFQSAVDRAARVLLEGGLVAFPTETVYGLGALITRPRAVARIFTVKGRPGDNPLILHVDGVPGARRLVAAWDETAGELAARFWPGPLTLVLPRGPVVPASVTAGLDTVAVRCPDHPLALALIARSGGPVAAPSANRSGRPSPTTAEHVLADLGGLIEMVLDGGPTPIGLESTVVDLTRRPAVLLRPGRVTLEDLRTTLGEVKLHPTVAGRAGLAGRVPAPGSGTAPPSPGMKYVHYAPRAPVVVVLGEPADVHPVLVGLVDQERKVGRRPALLLAAEFGRDWSVPLVEWGCLRRPETLAAGLFAGLRELDGMNPDVIFTHGVSPQGLGLAVLNRLLKAASRVYRAGGGRNRSLD